MKEYIERAAAEQVIAAIMPSMSTPDGAGANDEMVFAAQEMCADALSAVHRLPAADVAEVRHAFWSDYGSGVCCTNCGISLFHQDENNNWGIEPSKFTFCPSCGACMDEEDEHEAD